MQPVAFCNRCRGMKVSLNPRYIFHCLICKKWVSKSSKLLILTVLLSVLVISFPTPGTFVFSDLNPNQAVQQASLDASALVPNPAVLATAAFLEKEKVVGEHGLRVADAIVASGRKYNIDPRLIASIMIVERLANTLAISTKDSIGIMQIHLPTWGQTADKEGINLFKIEDNVDFGVRILRDYVRRHGMWDGVKRYKGYNSASVHSTQSVEEYVQKVQRLYAR